MGLKEVFLSNYRLKGQDLILNRPYKIGFEQNRCKTGLIEAKIDFALRKFG